MPIQQSILIWCSPRIGEAVVWKAVKPSGLKTVKRINLFKEIPGKPAQFLLHLHPFQAHFPTKRYTFQLWGRDVPKGTTSQSVPP